MIPIDKADILKLDDPDDKIFLKTLLIDGLYKATGRNRALIVQNDGKARYVIHRSIVDKYISEKVLGGTADPSALTLKDLSETGDNKSWISSQKFVTKKSTLKVAKDYIDSDPKCSDVLVTEDGTSSTRVIGWITNVAILEKAKA